MRVKALLTLVTASTIAVPAFAATTHVANMALGQRTDGLTDRGGGDDFTGALPANDGSGTLFASINVDSHASGRAAGIELEGNGFPSPDDFDWAFTFQFHDADGAFSFTENYDDRVQVNVTPIAGATDLTATGAGGPQHQDTSWNTRTYADYNFGSGGWFHAEVLLSEDSGGAQSAGGLGFGYSNTVSGNEADFGGIGYGAVFDTDADGLNWGSAIISAPVIDSDGDGIPDTIEEQYFPGDLTQLGLGDLDNDGVNDLQEIADGTDPTNPDTDGDGSSDGDEATLGTDPLDSDSDDDGLADGVETNTGTFNSPTDTGTDPLVADTDGDNFSDGNEVSQGSDPTDDTVFPRPPVSPHVANMALGQRTDGLTDRGGGDDFTGALPANDGSGTLFASINVDSHASGRAAGIELEGNGFPSPDDFDWAFTFQFHDADGAFSFTENYDDRVQVNVTPIAGATDLTATGAGGPQHQDTSWNTRTYADYNFGSGGWFHAEVLLSEDSGGAQSAGGLGFGYSNAASTGLESDFGLIGGGAVFDVDDFGLSFGSVICTSPTGSTDLYQFSVSSPDGGVNLEFTWNSFSGQQYAIVSTDDPVANPDPTFWAVWQENIAATPPENVGTYTRPADPRRFFVLVEKEAPPFFVEDFESGQGGWTTGVNDANGQTTWELGSPLTSTGPLTGADGSDNAFTTNIGDYADNADIFLRSPVIDLTGAGITSATLTMDHWRDADSFVDLFGVRILRASDLGLLGDIDPDSTVVDPDWESFSEILPASAVGEEIVLEFWFTSDASADAFSGWSIDNVEIDVQ